MRKGKVKTAKIIQYLSAREIILGFIIIGNNTADVLQKRKNVLQRFNIYFENSSKKVEGVRQT